MNRDEILATINKVLGNNGKPPVTDETIGLRDAGFRSLDFSEVALRIEDSIGRELNFEASAMRRIQSIGDVVDFFAGATSVNVA